MPKDLAGPEFPDDLQYLWGVFRRLHSMRDSDMNGRKRFTPAHILGGMELFGWTLAVDEIEALIVLDVATLYPGED